MASSTVHGKGNGMGSEFDTILGAYLGMNDWLKALWLVAPCLTLVALTGLMLRHRRLRSLPAGQTIYSISRMEDGEMRVFRHGKAGPALIARQYPPLVPLPLWTNESETSRESS